MAIQFIASNQTAGTTAAIPAHQTGDLLVVFAYRTGTNAQAALPAGWTNVHNTGLNMNSIRVGYKVAASSGEVSGTWTSANHLHVSVFRGQSTSNPIGAVGTVQGGTGTTITLPTTTLQRQDYTSRVLSFLGHIDSDVNIAAASGMTSLSKQGSSGTQSQVAMTSGVVDRFESRTVSAGSNSDGWRAVTVEIREEPPAVGFVSATKAGGWFTTYNHTVPPHVTSNDFMLLFAAASSMDVLTTPSGWTLLRRDQNGSGSATWVFWKIADSEPANYTLTWNGEHWHRSTMLVFRGYLSILTSAVVTYDHASSGAPQLTTINMPSVSGNVGEMLVGMGWSWLNTAQKDLAIPKLHSMELTSGGMTVGSEELETSGATETYAFECSAVGRMTTYAVLLEPEEVSAHEEVDALAFATEVEFDASGTLQAASSSPGLTADVSTEPSANLDAVASSEGVAAEVSATAAASLGASVHSSGVEVDASVAASASLGVSSVADPFAAELGYTNADVIAQFASVSQDFAAIATSSTEVVFRGFTVASVQEAVALFEEVEARADYLAQGNLSLEVAFDATARTDHTGDAEDLTASVTFDVTDSLGSDSGVEAFTVEVTFGSVSVDGASDSSAGPLLANLSFGTASVEAELVTMSDPLATEVGFSETDAALGLVSVSAGLDVVAFTGTAVVERTWDWSIYIVVQSSNTILPDATIVTPLPTLDMPTVIQSPGLNTALQNPGLLTELDDYGVPTAIPNPHTSTVIPAVPGENTPIENPPTNTQLPNPGLNTITPELS